jgi:hypothetical protein
MFIVTPNGKDTGKSDSTYDQAVLEEYEKEAEKAYEERKRKQKRELISLQRHQGMREERIQRGEAVAHEGSVLSSEAKDDSALRQQMKRGIFSRLAKETAYGTSTAKTKMQRVLRAGAGHVSLQKQREFLQMLGKFHQMRQGNLGHISKNEVAKFEIGLRRGTSDKHFKKFTEQLKKEGIIKRSDDVRKLFNRHDVRRMGGALLGKKSNDVLRPVGRAARTAERPDSPPGPSPEGRSGLRF